MSGFKFDWQWPAALVFSVVFLVLGALVYAGKLHIEVLLAALTWLAPGPWQKAGAPGGSVTQTTTTEVVAPSPGAH